MASFMDKFKTLLVKGLLHLSAQLPLSVARGLGRFLVVLYWPFGGRSKKVSLRNIELAYPELSAKEQQELARNSLLATGELIGEMGHVWLKPWSEVSRLIKEVHGAGLITGALAQGRGVVVLGPHLGNWEVAALHLATLGNMVGLYEPPKLTAIGELVKTVRERNGATLVPTTSRGLAALFKSVRGGGLTGVLPDQVPADMNSGQNSIFMGVPCFTGTLATSILQRTGALAVFGVARRVQGGFVISYHGAEPELYDADPEVSLAALNRGVEACFSRCVEQYQWEYKRFRVRPENGPGNYDDL